MAIPKLVKRGLRKGLIDGSKPWLVVGAVGGVLHLAKRLATPTEHVVYSEKLSPGEGLLITHFPDA